MRKAWGAAALLFLLVIQVWLSWRVDHTHPVPDYDEAVYADLAREMVRTGAPLRRMGEEPSFYYIHPFLQTVIWHWALSGEVSASAGESVTTALEHIVRLRWVTTSFALAVTLLVFLAGWKSSGPGTACMGAALISLNPLWLKYAHLVYLEVPAALWVFTGLLLLGSAFAQPNRWLYPVAGALFGAGMITKYTALGGLLTVALLALVKIYRKEARALDLLQFAGGFAVIFATWPLYILWKGNMADWIAKSLSRWRSFQQGQGGDPRTDWSLIELYRETALDIGPVHLALLIVGICAFFTLHYMGRKNRSGTEAKNPAGDVSPHALYVAITAIIWSASPTRDPKFITVALPSICLLAAVGWREIYSRTIGGPAWKRRSIIGAGVVGLIIGFPVDLLRLDQSRFRWVYPTDHAYTRTCLPHGKEYPPIVERVASETLPDAVLPVGRQGPILGYLADRKYYLLYTFYGADKIQDLLDDSPLMVLDDSWENCFSGLPHADFIEIRGAIEGRYRTQSEAGRVRLLGKVELPR